MSPAKKKRPIPRENLALEKLTKKELVEIINTLQAGSAAEAQIIDSLEAETQHLMKRLAAIDTGCFNCGGLPHTTNCNVRDVKSLLRRHDASLDLMRGLLNDLEVHVSDNGGVSFNEQNVKSAVVRDMLALVGNRAEVYEDRVVLMGLDILRYANRIREHGINAIDNAYEKDLDISAQEVLAKLNLSEIPLP